MSTCNKMETFHLYSILEGHYKNQFKMDLWLTHKVRNFKIDSRGGHRVNNAAIKDFEADSRSTAKRGKMRYGQLS